MKPGERAVAGQGDQPLEPDALLDLGALDRRPLVVPEDGRAEDAIVFVEADEPVHLAREADAAGSTPSCRERELGCARTQSSGSCSAQPGCGVESGYPSSADASTSPSGVIAIALTPVVPTSRPTSVRHALTRRRERRRRARTRATASFRDWASRSAASSIFAATESMKRHWRTLRLTASTASSVYG